jgi:hypothetical protein
MVVFVASGCGSSHHNIAMQNDYVMKPSSKVEVGKVINTTGEQFDVNVEQMLSDALVKKLGEEHLLYASNAGQKVSTNCKILTYEKGNAFKRWLMPGWGATSLSIQCDLFDSNKVVGSLNAMKSVTAGGAYTVGAWEKVFADIADDVVEDIKTKVK